MGLQTNLQLGDARLQLAQARGNEAQALHDYYVALARLLRAAGAPESEVVTRSVPGGGAR
jgi:outer membrane protein TolC